MSRMLVAKFQLTLFHAYYFKSSASIRSTVCVLEI